MNMSLIELWGTMGWFAKGIVVLLLLMSIFVVAVSARKLFELGRSRQATLLFSPLFSEALTRDDFEEADQVVQRHPKSHLAAVFRRAFSVLSGLARRGGIPPEEIHATQRLLELNGLEQIAQFRRGLGVLATVGSTAPFVGLLGTTMGVVNAFTGIASSGTGGLAAISAGIAEALITTALGIFVAIPAVWLYNYFVNRIELLSMEITYGSKEFIDYLERYVRARSTQSVRDGLHHSSVPAMAGATR
jgi:biopolymer transport protein ExbB/biopolymer transport protein TolQ